MISRSTMAIAVAASMLVGLPARAAMLDPERTGAAGHQTLGTFAGARLQLQLGAKPRARAALALAPLGRAVGPDGAVQMRFGEGLAFGAAPQGRPALTLAGTRVDRLGMRDDGEDLPTGERQNLSTAGYVAIGVGAVLVAAFLVYGAIGDAATE